jgi:hypothetical protein
VVTPTIQPGRGRDERQRQAVIHVGADIGIEDQALRRYGSSSCAETACMLSQVSLPGEVSRRRETAGWSRRSVIRAVKPLGAPTLPLLKGNSAHRHNKGTVAQHLDNDERAIQ